MSLCFKYFVQVCFIFSGFEQWYGSVKLVNKKGRVKITLHFNILMCQYEINCLRQMEYAVLISCA